jgi:hypothetical protein
MPERPAGVEGAFVEGTPSLSVVIEEVSEFILPPAVAAATEQSFKLHWKPHNRWQPVR